MTPAEQRKAAAAFAAFWKDKGSERGQSQPFWLSLLRDVFGVEHPEAYIEFEDRANIDRRHGFIDGYIPATRVMVEQKSKGKSLTQGIVQADGSVLTPFQQAKRYRLELPFSRQPRWIVTSNFESFLVYDMEQPNAEPEKVLLADLPKEYYRLSFLVKTKAEDIRREEEISKNAGAIVRKIYDAFLSQYADPEDPATLDSLNQLCVRLVFLWFCEDAEVFGHNQFGAYLKRFDARDARRALIDLFKTLDTPEAKRDKYLDADLAAFPYTNGGLMRGELEIPQLTEELKTLIVEEGSGFDWREISPTIFGSIMESTLNPETRHDTGAHFTTREAIHKVIDPLFLTRLTRELDRIEKEPNPRKRAEQAEAFIVKLSKLRILDPACGSGNFLTECFTCLRKLENRALAMILAVQSKTGAQGVFDLGDGGLKIRVSINQFFGIELNPFSCAVATCAMFIAELKMQKETAAILFHNVPNLPLREYSGIVHGNALQTDWASLCPEGFDYVASNPPFLGYSEQSPEQKADILALYRDESGKPLKTAGKIDFVAGWYWKAAEMVSKTGARVALVSTNSITQGEQTASVFRPLVERFGFTIDFAHRTFKWSSDSDNKAAVHCVIIGFHCGGEDTEKQKPIFDNGRITLAEHINAYLMPASEVWIESPSKPFSDVPEITNGSKPVDGGHLLLSPEEAAQILAENPKAEPFVRKAAGADGFLNNVDRFCLWLVGADPSTLRECPLVMERVKAVRDFRLASPKEATRKSAEQPTLFQQIRQPSEPFIFVPRHSSENRRYIPFAFMTPDIVPLDSAQYIPGASLYHFGVLSSNVHNAWARAVAGRLKSDYRYSAKIVYNNFPWPETTEEQRDKIAKTAQGILDARAKYPNASLADLYDELTMPPELREAHRANDRACLEAYGFPKTISESDCVAALFERYKALVASKGK